MKNTQPNGFIPANEHKFVIWFFKWFTFYSMKFRFKNVYFRTNYTPHDQDSTLILGNHHSWWDGLIPLLINEFVFKQQARAVMEDKQLQKHPFFSRIGAFSINREHLKSALFSLNYCAQWLKNPGNSLFLYPEGKITSVTTAIQVEPGFLKILQQTPEVKVVLMTILINCTHQSKPDLILDIYGPIQIALPTDKLITVNGINKIMNERRILIGEQTLRDPKKFDFTKLV